MRDAIDITESSHERATISPLHLVDVMTFDPVDREAYWSGPDGEITVLTRIGEPVDAPAGFGIHTIVIYLHESSRDKWEATRDLDCDDLERFEQQAVREDERREQVDRDESEAAKLAAIRTNRPPAVIGYDREGRPVYDDSNMVTNWGE